MMKKIGFLFAITFVLAACDSKPGGNKGILPVTHDGNIEEIDLSAQQPEETAATAEDVAPTADTIVIEDTVTNEPAANIEEDIPATE